MITFLNRWYWRRKFGRGFSDRYLGQLRYIYRLHQPRALILTVKGQRTIRCLSCEISSYHPEDIANHYCGRCHVFFDWVMVVEPETTD